jgi:nucleotide-binding universal stress UspA family protein
MKHVLLVTSPVTDAPRAVAYALERAQALGHGLLALAVLDPEVTQRVAATLTDVGFVGDRVSDSVMHTLAREQRAQAERLLKEIGARAAAAGVAYTPLIEEGDPSEVCDRVITQYAVESAVLVAERRSWLSRFLSHSAPLRLPSLAGCEVKVMED